jgi:hypothetical protein
MSAGISLRSLLEKPNIIFIHERKKNVGPNKYKKNNKKIAPVGNKSKKKEKNKISETKKIDPGKPKNIKIFKRTTRNNLGHI